MEESPIRVSKTAAFEKTSAFVQSYERGGKLLIKHQSVASRLADMAIRITSVRTLVNQAALAVNTYSGCIHFSAYGCNS